MYPLRHHDKKAPPIRPKWKPSWMRNWEGRWKSITSPERPSLSSKTASCFCQRLRLRRSQEQDPCRPRSDELSHWLTREAVHLDGGDAARRAGKVGPGRGYQHLSRLSHPGYLSTTDHPQAPDDPYGRLRKPVLREAGEGSQCPGAPTRMAYLPYAGSGSPAR